jgi:LysM repeat protein
MNESFDNKTDPEESDIAKKLRAIAEQTQAPPHFINELEQRLREKHRPRKRWALAWMDVSPTLSWVVLAIAVSFLLIWSIRTLVPAPQPAVNDTPSVTDIPTPTPVRINMTLTPVTESESYDWRGTKVYLSVPLPESPAEASIYLLKDEEQATVELSRTLAEQFGIQGEVYVPGGLYPSDTGYFITDGKQSLLVNSSRYFTYTADMAKAYNNFGAVTNPDAEQIINKFLQSHGFDFPHKIEEAGLYGGYDVMPLSPDGFPLRYEYFSSLPMHIILDDSGQVLQLECNLMDYESIGPQKYPIITADEAFQKMLDDTIPAGKIESVHSASMSEIDEWKRDYPRDETITIYGYAHSDPALDLAKPHFIQIDGYTATGNTNGIEALEPNTFIQATGEFIDDNGIGKFNVASWQPSPFQQDGLGGTLRGKSGQVSFYTELGEQLTVEPDVPADLPLPFENAFVVGVRKGDIYEWTVIDTRMSDSGHRGGGGSGGLGLYKLNLSGTPVSFPTVTPTPSVGAGKANYIVRESDTLSSIAAKFGVTVEELMAANNIPEPGVIYIDQPLIIPGMESIRPEIGQKIEAQRGIINITLYNQTDGSPRAEYVLYYLPEHALYPTIMKLEGENLDGLQAYQNRPVEIWGTVESYDEGNGMSTVKVEQYEIPFPDLQFQILRGTQKSTMVDGQIATLFTTNGDSYVQTSAGGDLGTPVLGREGDEVILEVLAIPDETVGGYPALRVFSSAMAISPKNEKPVELTITANQIYTVDERPEEMETYVPLALTIEKVELMYYVTNPHWQVDHLDGSPLYIQPVWRFSGHYDNGDEWEVLVQALKEEYLLPELAPYVTGG